MYIGVRDVLKHEVFYVCISSFCEVPHNGFFLLGDVVDLCPSAAKFLSDRAVTLPRPDGFDHIHTSMERGSTLHALFDGVPFDPVGEYFTNLVYRCLSMHLWKIEGNECI